MSVFSKPYDPDIPTRGDSTRTNAVRVDAHKEGKKNDFKPISRAMPTGPLGKLGLRGNAQQK